MSSVKITSSGKLFALGESGAAFEDSGYRFQEALLQHLGSKMGEENNSRKTGVFSPSGFYGCARKAAYGRSGAKRYMNTPPRKQLIFGTGHAIHDMLNAYVKEMYPPEIADTEIEIAYEEIGIGGETDMVVYVSLSDEVMHIVDFKTIATDGFQKLRMPRIENGEVYPESMTRYVWQLHCYMLATDCPSASLYYINKNDSTSIEFPVVYNHELAKRIVKRAAEIDKYLAAGELPSREIDSFCAECEFFQLCTPPGVRQAKYNG